MEYTLTLKNYSAIVTTKGAELLSLKKDNEEILWCRDQQFWGDSALVLFPFIGRNFQDSYIYNGKTYNMPIHGFASKSEFDVIDKTESSLTLQLKENETTLENYPFHFTFQIKFELTNNGLQVHFDITNTSLSDMPYCLGYHPGFQLHDKLENYSISLPLNDDPKEIGIVTKCMLNGEIAPLQLDNNKLSLNKALFTNSAKVYTNLGNKSILLHNDKPMVEVEFEGFKNNAIWQTLNSDADFICIEGWAGLPGQYEVIEDINKVKAKTILKSNKSKSYKVTIKF